MGQDYYSILGITRNANIGDIKKAYRKLAIKVHPNKSVDDEAEKGKFKEVSEAYEVLSDPERRAIYDQYGEEGLKHGNPGGFHYESQDAKEIFEKFFGTDNPFAAVHREGTGEIDQYFPMNGVFGGRPAVPQKASPVEKPLNVTLEELYTGTTKKVKLTKQVINSDGKTTRPEQKILQINVKQGWKKGTKVTFPNEGDAGPGIIPADVVYVVEEKPHPNYKRDGDNLIYTADISLEKALTGTTLNLPTLDGRSLPIPINDIVTPQYVKIIPREGMPNSKTGQKGDLHVHFNIQFPTYLSSTQKQYVKQAFSPENATSPNPAPRHPPVPNPPAAENH